MRAAVPRPLHAVLVLTLLGIMLLVLIPRLVINNSPLVYLPSNLQAMQVEQQLRAYFSSDELLVAAFAGEDLFEDQFLSKLDTLVAELLSHELVDQVLAPSTIERIAGRDDSITVENLLGPEVWPELSTSARKQRVLAHRFARGLLVSDSGEVIAIAVRPVELNLSEQRRQLVDDFLDLVDQIHLSAHLRAVTGQVALDAAQMDMIIRDSMIFAPASLLVGMLMLLWMFRSWLTALSLLIVVSFSAGSSLAVLVLLGQPYTLISAAILPLNAGLAVALLMHLFNAISFARRGGRLEPRELVLQARQHIHRPALLTALTTMAGLLSLTISEVLPVRAFGAAAAAGVLVQYLVVFWLLPSFLMVRHSANLPASSRLLNTVDRLTRWLRALGLRHPVKVLCLFGLLMMISLPWLGRIESESDFERFFQAEHPLVQSTEFFIEHLAGPAMIQILWHSGQTNGFLEPERLALLGQLQEWLTERDEVDRVTSIRHVLEELNWAFHGEDESQRRVPDDRNLITQYLLLYDGEELYELVDRSFSVTRLMVNLNVTGSNAVALLLKDLENWSDANLSTEAASGVGGAMSLFVEFERLLVSGQLNGLLIALLCIWIMMAIGWQSARAATFCLFPNFSPVLAIFVVMGVFGIWLDVVTATVASVAVGIAVDDTLHLYHAYRTRRRAGASPVWALARAFQRTGRAVTATTFTLGAIFLLMASSDFVPVTNFGILTAAGLVTAWLFDLIVLPALLLVLDRSPARRNTK